MVRSKRTCALGVFGTQLGQAIGFILPPMVIKNHDQIELIGRDLGWLVKGLALFTLIVTVAILAYFPARPPLKPFANNGDEKHDFLNSLKKLFHNRSFNFHAVAYGINIAVFVSISTLLNQFMLFYFPVSAKWYFRSLIFDSTEIRRRRWTHWVIDGNFGYDRGDRFRLYFR
jgi:FLVCR family feline leukemia virus subgroup C receptor-related protein